MKKKYLAYCLALSMALTAAAPVAAAEPVDIVVEDDSEDTAVDFEESNEEAEVAAEEVEEAVDEADTSDVETEAADFGDGEEAAPAVGEGDTTEDGWVKMSAYRPSYADSTMEAKYDEQTQTLYLRVSQPEEMQDANSSVTPWYKYLKEKDLVTEVKKIVIGEGITRVGSKNFTKVSGRDFYDSLEEVVLPSTVTEIGIQAFSAAMSLKKINLENVSTIGKAAFTRTALDSVTFDVDEITLGGNVFAGSSLTSFKAKKVTFTGTDTFYDCKSLKNFEVEVSLDEVPEDTFMDCEALTSFDFKNIKKLGFFSFYCVNLKNGCYDGTREEWKALLENREWGEAGLPDDIKVHCKGDAVEVKDATCTENGYKEVGTCEVCGAHYSYKDDENVIPALGHDYEAEFTVDKVATCTEPGVKSKHCTRCDAKTEEQVIPAAGHKWSAWKKTADATVNALEQQVRKCSVCGKEEAQTVGTKLAPKMAVNATTVTLKVKQSTNGLKVTGLATGDSVKSWKSSNTKVFTVSGKANGTCKITGKKKGTAKLEITLASGLKKTVRVKVQKTAVKTTKISGLKKSVALKKGKKTTLKPVITPFTSREKVTYRSSNKKVATVSSKGVVTAKKKGTAKITVRSGKKSYTVKVTVK